MPRQRTRTSCLPDPDLKKKDTNCGLHVSWFDSSPMVRGPSTAHTPDRDFHSRIRFLCVCRNQKCRATQRSRGEFPSYLRQRNEQRQVEKDCQLAPPRAVYCRSPLAQGLRTIVMEQSAFVALFLKPRPHAREHGIDNMKQFGSRVQALGSCQSQCSSVSDTCQVVVFRSRSCQDLHAGHARLCRSCLATATLPGRASSSKTTGKHESQSDVRSLTRNHSSQAKTAVQQALQISNSCCIQHEPQKVSAKSTSDYGWPA